MDDARVGLVIHAAGQRTPRHDHDRACLHVVLRGLYVEHSPAGTTVAGPGDVVAKGPGVEHWNRFGVVGAESLRFELEEPGELAGWRARVDDVAGVGRALAWARSLRRPTDDRARSLPCSPQAHLLMRLRRDFRRKLVIGAVADELRVHRSHLCRQFTRDFGCSPQSYVALKRSAWVAEQLGRGRGPLASLALDAGFADQSHCTRTFKRVFGATPSEWVRGAAP